MPARFSSKKLYVFTLLIGSAFVWGMAFTMTSHGCSVVGTVPFQTVRWTVAGIAMVLIMFQQKQRFKVNGRSLKYLIMLVSIQPCTYYLFESYGIQHTSASTAAIFTATIPCAVLVLNTLLYGHRTSFGGFLCILVAFSGVAISTILSPSFTLAGGKASGYIALIISVILGGGYTVWTVKAAETFSLIEISVFCNVVGAIYYNIICFAMGYGFSAYEAVFTHPRVLFEVCFLGILCSCICCLMFNKAITLMNPALADNICSSTTTVIGTVSGIIILGETAGWYTAVGLIVTLTGVILSARQIEE